MLLTTLGHTKSFRGLEYISKCSKTKQAEERGIVHLVQIIQQTLARSAILDLPSQTEKGIPDVALPPRMLFLVFTNQRCPEKALLSADSG